MRGARRVAHASLVLALALLVVVPVAAPGGLAGLGAATPAAAAATDLTLVTDATYTVRPDDGRVSVTVAVAARNRTKETRTRRFWFDHAFLAVQPGATNLRLSGAPGARVRVARRQPEATLLRLDFGSRLYSGRSATLRLTFDLPGTGDGASPQVRVGPSLVTLPVWAFASNGAKGSTVTVRVPGGWDVAVETGELRRRDGADGTIVLESGRIASPLSWFAYVTANQPAVFEDRPVTLDDGSRPVSLVLRGWADDPGWSGRVERLFAAALPRLREAIGVPWPLDAPLVVVESVAREGDAVAGRFDPGTGRMELAYWADHEVVVHQAAHAWFGGALLADRWANEGFATYFGLRAAAALGEPADPPVMSDEAQAAALPLVEWGGSGGATTPEERYGDVASYRVAAAIVELVGREALAATLADAAAGTGAYQPPATAVGGAATSGVAGVPAGDPPPETVAGPPDWRGLLDLLEAHGERDLDPLWRAWIVDADGAAALDARALSRATYARTLTIAGDWQLPRAVRDALRAWDFPTADALMADARTVLAQRNALADLAAREGVRQTGEVRALFEAGRLAEASARAEAERNAILALVAAEASRSATDDPLSRIGMLGEAPELELVAAREALDAGDLDASLAASSRASRAWTDAAEEGRRRALLGLAALATLLVLASAVLGHLRRSRRAGASTVGSAAAPPPADDGAASA